MKQLAAAVAVLLLAAGSALAQDNGAPAKDASPAKEASPTKEAPSPKEASSPKEAFLASRLQAVCAHDMKDATPQDIAAMEQTCVAYFQGLTDAIFVMQSLKRHHTTACMPKGKRIEVPQARADFEAWLKDHPDAQSSSAGLIAAMSIIGAYHCK